MTSFSVSLSHFYPCSITWPSHAVPNPSPFCASGCPKVPGLGRSCKESRGDGAVGSSSPAGDTGDAASPAGLSSLKAIKHGEMSVPRPCDQAPACVLLGGWKHGIKYPLCIHWMGNYPYEEI